MERLFTFSRKWKREEGCRVGWGSGGKKCLDKEQSESFFMSVLVELYVDP